MSYGDLAIECLRTNLASCRDINSKWVVVYQGIKDTDMPMYLRLTDNLRDGWTAAGIDNCTLFDTYSAACAAARKSSYIMNRGALARVLQLNVKVSVSVDLLAEHPVSVLDALAEL